MRYIGDNYYDEVLEEDILKTKEFNEKGFYTIEKNLYFYTLLYHAFLHKKQFAKDYKERLVEMKIENIKIDSDEQQFVERLNQWLLKNQYIVKIPNDVSVQFNPENAKKLSKLVYRNEEELQKLKNLNNELKVENENLKNKNEHLETELNHMVNSLSWKSTKWIRDFHTYLKNKE